MTNTKMVMAEQENVVVVAHRDEYISDDEKDPEICRFKNIQTFPFGHRREVTCLDMDEVIFKKKNYLDFFKFSMFTVNIFKNFRPPKLSFLEVVIEVLLHGIYFKVPNLIVKKKLIVA